MKIVADTNLLVRLLVQDDKEQGEIAAMIFKEAELIAVSTTSLCELVWVLCGTYGFDRNDAATALRMLANTDKVETNKLAIEAGLAVMENGGDFADGVIAHEGNWLGGEVFVSFDKRAVSILKAAGNNAVIAGEKA